eukprot:1766739-Prymnesium_polylepis.1
MNAEPRSKPQPRTHASLTKVDTHTPKQPKRCGLASAYSSPSRVERAVPMRDVLHPNHAPPPSKTDTHFTVSRQCI